MSGGRGNSVGLGEETHSEVEGSRRPCSPAAHFISLVSRVGKGLLTGQRKVRERGIDSDADPRVAQAG